MSGVQPKSAVLSTLARCSTKISAMAGLMAKQDLVEHHNMKPDGDWQTQTRSLTVSCLLKPSGHTWRGDNAGRKKKSLSAPSVLVFTLALALSKFFIM